MPVPAGKGQIHVDKLTSKQQNFNPLLRGRLEVGAFEVGGNVLASRS